MSNLLEKASILTTPTAYNDGKILSVKPNTSVGDFDFTRNSSATRVNAQGLVEDVQILSSNLVSNGDFSNGSTGWTLGAGWSIGDGEAIHTGTVGYIQQNNLGASGVNAIYKAKWTQNITAGTRLRFFARNYNDSGNETILSGSTTGEGSFGLNGNCVGSGTFTAFVSSTNGYSFKMLGETGVNADITNISVIEITDDTNLPRIDYTDGVGSWLFEPQSTNLFLNSETLLTQGVSTNAASYTVSFYGTGSITFSGTHTGTLSGTGVSDRVSLTFTASSGTLTSTVSGSVIKAQLEQNSFATSYIPTSGSTVTRLQDAAFGAGSSDLINSTEGVLYAEIAALADDGTNRNISLSKDAGNRVNILYRTGSNRIRFIVRINNANLFDTSITLSNITNYNKVALSFKENEFKVYINGVKEAEQLSGSIYPTDTLDKLGFNQNISGGSPFYGKTKCVAVFKEALTDAELTCLTTI